jgi:Icc-related predicted phosphoesterase
MKHYYFLDSNYSGDIWLLGDIHGRLKRLIEADALLTKAGEGHVLILVGDLVDRGDHSLEVVEKIIAMRAEGKKVYSVAGNHEIYCLETISAFEEVIAQCFKFTQEGDDPKTLAEDLLRLLLENTHINFHVYKNGGMWLFFLYLQELGANLIKLTNEGISYEPGSKVLKVREFFKSLPYIIAVKAKISTTALIAAHGDLFFNSSELMRRIMKGQQLEKDEIAYIVGARKEKFADNGRTPSSILTYCGHNIFGETFSAVRKEVNAVSIDGGDMAIIVNHTRKEILLLHNPPEVLTPDKLKEFAALQAHLAFQKKYQLLCEKIATQCESLLQLHDLVCQDLPAQADSNEYDDFILFMFYQGSLRRFGIERISDYHPCLEQSRMGNLQPEKRATDSEDSLSGSFFKKTKTDKLANNAAPILTDPEMPDPGCEPTCEF